MADEIPAKPETKEVVPSHDGDAWLAAWADGIREPDDPILKGRGGDLKLYDQVRSDGQVWSALQQRRDNVIDLPWDVVPGDADDAASVAAAEEMKEQLSGIEIDTVFRRLHWSVFYGYAVGEVMWAIEDSRVTIARVKVRRARRFGFDMDGSLMLRPVAGRDAEKMPPAKFWLPVTGADTDDEPYGLGLAHLLYWPAYFKRHGLKAWMIALDKYAGPTAYGTYPSGTTDEDKAKLLAGLRAIKQDSAFIIPEGMEAGYLETSKSAGMDYKAFHEHMDGMVSKIVNGQTMTADDGSSQSQAEVHERVGDKVAASDASLICDAFNRGPAVWWTHWNYGDRALPPRLTREQPDAEDVETAIERDEKLSRIGWQPTEGRIETVYGNGYERGKPPAAGAQPPPVPEPTTMAQGETDAIADFVQAVMADGTAPSAVNDMLAPLAEAIEGAATLEDLRAALDGLALSDAPLEPFREHLAQAMFAARIGGEVGAEIHDGVVSEEA